MTRRAIWATGIGQLVNWGVLYYAFGVLLVPVERDLQVPRWIVAGAFSAGLLVSAAAAPYSGRLTDRGQGPVVMRAGGFIAAGLLIAWASVPTIWMTYLVWAALGACMAGILYEPVFAMIGRAFADPDDRLRAIATITVMGGLASTVFLPGTAWLVDVAGWRGAVAILAGILALSTLLVGRVGFGAGGRDHFSSAGVSQGRPKDGPDPFFTATFAISSVVNSAVASNIVAALIDRQLTAGTAATIGGLFGVMQLPGRVWMTHRVSAPGPVMLVITSFVVQIAGLIVLAASDRQAGLWLGVMIFAAGAGMTTLARPYLVLRVYGTDRAGYVNGVIARGQQLGRAAGPVAAASMATVSGYATVFITLAVMLMISSVLMLGRK